jgi:hypothetical protein
MAAVALAAACGDGVAPEAAGLYRLESVAGSPLPYSLPPSLGFYTVRGGELLLKPDGTFIHGLAPGFGPVRGTFEVSASGNIRLTVENGGMPFDVTGRWSHESVTLNFPPELGAPPDYVFRRVIPESSPASDGLYVLTSLNGGDLEVEMGPETVFRVPFDSIAFHDGVFYRRHRREASVYRPGEPDSLVSSTEFLGGGSFRVDGSRIILQRYYDLTGTSPLDTLQVQDGALTRTSPALGGLTERYQRP